MAKSSEVASAATSTNQWKSYDTCDYNLYLDIVLYTSASAWFLLVLDCASQADHVDVVVSPTINAAAIIIMSMEQEQEDDEYHDVVLIIQFVD